MNRTLLTLGLTVSSTIFSCVLFTPSCLEAGLFSRKQPVNDSCETESYLADSSLEKSCCPISGNGFFLYGEYLFWDAWQEGLQLAGEGTLYPGAIKAVHFNWQSGFRAGLGGNFSDGWGITADYTYIKPHGTKTMNSKTGESIYPFLVPGLTAGGFQWNLGDDPITMGLTSAFTHADGTVSLKYNVIDLEVERALCCLPCFDFFLIGGGQGAWVKETFGGNFSGGAIVRYKVEGDAFQEAVPFSLAASQQWEFRGGGLKVGAAGEYHHPCGFFLTTGGRVNLLFGRYQNYYDSRVIKVGTEEGTIDQDGNKALIAQPIIQGFYEFSGNESFLDFTPNAQLRLGLGYQYLGCVWSMRLGLEYEVTYWHNLAQLREGLANSVDYIEPFQETTSVIFTNRGGETQRTSSSLGLQGLTASLEFKF